MHNNGVTHTTVPDDFEGVFTILQWLSYMPKVCGYQSKSLNEFSPSVHPFLVLQNQQSPVPVIPTTDSVDREIDFIPTKAPYDPRWMLAGRPHPSESRQKRLNVASSWFLMSLWCVQRLEAPGKVGSLIMTPSWRSWAPGLRRWWWAERGTSTLRLRTHLSEH